MNKWEKAVAKSQLDDEKAVIAELEKQYKAALKDIDLNIRLLMSDELTQSRLQQLNYQKALREQVNGILTQLHGKNFTTIQQYLTECYQSGYIGTMYSIAGQGIPIITPLNQDAIVHAVTTNSKLSEPLYESLGLDIQALKKSVTAEITRGFSSNLSYEEIARNIGFEAGIPMRRAQTIARTEGHRVQQEAAADARNEAKERGCDVLKQWDSTLDGNTRDTHRELDGQIREVDEPFEVDGKKADMPGGFGDPAEDINCRCVALTRARWGLDKDELDRLKERAEFFGLDKKESYEEYKEKYLKAAETVEKEEKIKFTPAKTIEEAEEFASQFVDKNTFFSVGLSYKGVHVDIANGINETLNKFYNLFNVEKLGGIAAPAKNTKLGKMINAHAAYSPVRKSLIMNRDNTKSMEKFLSGLFADKNAVDDFLKNPNKYDLSRTNKRVAHVLTSAKISGRGLVAENLEDAIMHELGHHLENFISKEQYKTISDRKPDFEEKISGYATDSLSEYIAESFTSYMKGENLIDTYLREIFDGWRK